MLSKVHSNLRKYEINTLFTENNKLNLDVQVANVNKIGNYANATADRSRHSTVDVLTEAHGLKRNLEQTKYWTGADIRDLAVKNIKITNQLNRENDIKYYG